MNIKQRVLYNRQKLTLKSFFCFIPFYSSKKLFYTSTWQKNMFQMVPLYIIKKKKKIGYEFNIKYSSVKLVK